MVSKNIQWSYEIQARKKCLARRQMESLRWRTARISLQSENFVIKLATACRMVRKLHFPERSRQLKKVREFTKRQLKMAAEYWSSSFLRFFFVFDRDGVNKVNKNAKKRGQYSAILTQQAWLIKDLLYCQKENFCLQDQREKSRESKMGSSCPFGQQDSQDSLHQARSRIQPYNKY